MSRSYTRSARRAVLDNKRAMPDLPPEDEDRGEDDEGGIDGDRRVPIGPLDVLPLRDGGSVELRAPWELPR